MSDITSTISETPLLTSTVSGSTTVQVSTFSEGGRTLSELTDIDLQGVTNGSLLVYDNNEFVARTLSGVNYGVVTNAFPTGVSSGVASINWQAGTYWSGYLGLVGGTLIQFQNVIPGKIIILSITGSGSPVAWPNGITWLAGSAPSLSVSGQTRIIKILATSVSTFIGAVDTI
jgi:hypothetical protein